MIVRGTDIAPRDSTASTGTDTVRRWPYSDLGGLTLVGSAVDGLAPGMQSSDRHRHEREDEMILVLSGVATLVDDHGARALTPGMAACWPGGATEAHMIRNEGAAECRYLVIGSRPRVDVVHYPDTGRTLYNSDDSWRIEGPAGEVLRSGPLEGPHRGTLDIPLPEQGRSAAVLTVADLPEERMPSAYPEPFDIGGVCFCRPLSEAGGITQFGAYVERIEAGATGSLPHWHEREDEFLYVLSGTVTVIEDGVEHALHEGDAGCWPAGVPVAHTIRNRGTQDANYVILGTRSPDEVCHYPGLDLRLVRTGGKGSFTSLDGTPWPRRTAP